MLIYHGVWPQDGDGNLDLTEFSTIVHDVDSGKATATAGLSSTYMAPSERIDKEVSGMYMYAVEADEDDDDMISPVCLHCALGHTATAPAARSSIVRRCAGGFYRCMLHVHAGNRSASPEKEGAGESEGFCEGP